MRPEQQETSGAYPDLTCENQSSWRPDESSGLQRAARYHATELAEVRPGESVAVFGAGPVGLVAAYSALIRGASQVMLVDRHADRLKLAEKIGAIRRSCCGPRGLSLAPSARGDQFIAQGISSTDPAPTRGRTPRFRSRCGAATD